MATLFDKENGYCYHKLREGILLSVDEFIASSY